MQSKQLRLQRTTANHNSKKHVLCFPLRHECFKKDNITLGDDLFSFVHGLRYKQQMSKRLALAGGFEAHPLDPEATSMLMNEFQQDETRAQHTSFVFLLQIRASNYILRGYCQNTTVAKYIYNVCTNHCLGINLQHFKTTLHGMTAYLCNLTVLCLALLPDCFHRRYVAVSYQSQQINVAHTK